MVGEEGASGWRDGVWWWSEESYEGVEKVVAGNGVEGGGTVAGLTEEGGGRGEERR